MLPLCSLACFFQMMIIMICYYPTIISDCFPAWQLPHHSSFGHHSLQALCSTTLQIIFFFFLLLLVKISLWFCSGTCVTYLYILYKSMNICIPNKRLDKNFLNFVFYTHSFVFNQNRSGCFVLDFSVSCEALVVCYIFL